MKVSFRYEIKKEKIINSETIVQLILKNRKIKNIDEFLNPPSPLSINISDFGFKKEIKKTLQILEEIKKSRQTIVVYTDYDADGITGGAILWETLYLLGFKVMPYVPHRKLEGYGFSIKGIDKIKKQFNPRLIISVDHGITAKKQIAYAKSLGISVIITDHHLHQPDRLPTDYAEAIFYIPELSGSGVSYFFSKTIFDYFKVVDRQSISTSNFSLLTSHFSLDYLALASIGTIADLVPLVGPSRSLVKYGLEAFTKVKRQGLKHILKEASIEGKKITPYEVGFIIAPRINAVGRLEHAIDALRLLCTTNEKRAYDLACKVGSKNVERQELVEKSVEEARMVISYQLSVAKKNGAKQANFYSATCVKALAQEKDFFALAGNKNLSASELNIPKLIILVSEKWHEGIIGLIASKIAEEYYRPTIVITKTDEVYKGSARSIPGLHITDFLRSLKEYLIDVGGHKGAAGFTISKDKITTFTTTASKVANKLIKDQDLEKKIQVDIKIPISKVNLPLAKLLEKLAPFGIGNPQPTFYSQAELVDARIFGKKNEHLKLFLKDPPSQLLLECFLFNASHQFPSLSRGQKIKIVYNLEINKWNGKEKVRGKIIEIIK